MIPNENTSAVSEYFSDCFTERRLAVGPWREAAEGQGRGKDRKERKARPRQAHENKSKDKR